MIGKGKKKLSGSFPSVCPNLENFYRADWESISC